MSETQQQLNDYQINRVRITWFQNGKYGQPKITHPWKWEVTEPDNYQRYFDTKREAIEWITQEVEI